MLWVGGGLAAAILVLGVNGTLSGWTSAIIDNPSNDVAVTGAVALVETGPGGTCDTGTSSTNQATCNTVNTYGGTAVPLDPDSNTGGNAQAVSVNLKNSGTADGNLVLTADSCLSSALGGAPTADPTNFPVCTQVTVEVACTGTGMLDTTGSAQALSAFTGGTIGPLAAGASTDCTFTLTLPAGTPSAYSSQVAAQAVHWTLS